MDPDQNVGPSLSPNCLQRLTADVKKMKYRWQAKSYPHVMLPLSATGVNINIKQKKYLLFACWVIFSCLSCRLLTFFKFTFSKNTSRNTIRVLNSLEPDQDIHSVIPDLGPNCLQRFNSRRQKSPLAWKELWHL